MACDNASRQRFVEALYDRVRRRITGEGEDLCFDEKPSERYFAGTLCLKESPSTISQKKKTVVSPFNIGLQFLLNKEDLAGASIKVSPRGSVYYRIFPTLEQQVEAAEEYRKKTGAHLHGSMQASKNAKEDPFLVPLRRVFKKIKFPETWSTFSLAQCAANPDFELEETLNVSDIRSHLMSQWANDDNRFAAKRYSSSKTETRDRESKIPFSILSNRSAFEELIKSWGSGHKQPKWEFRVYIETTEFNESQVLVAVKLENEASGRTYEDSEEFIFESGLQVEVDGAKIAPYVLTHLKDDYKYDGNVEANGINCAAIRSKNLLITEHMPVYKQKRLETQPKPRTDFDYIISDPVKALEEIKIEMEEAVNSYRRIEQGLTLTDVGKLKYDSDLQEFETEIERFSVGIECIRNYGDVKEAFVLMNKTFQDSPKAFSSWYLFQIVFIVMLIPDIVSPKYSVSNHRDNVDILFFPTGGGKTEAYLGLVVFLMFWDRLNGKSEGCSAMTKFPLRLLSLQQLQRISNIFGRAELIRRHHLELSKEPNNPFSLGFFVGKNNTPNKLFDDQSGISINNLQAVKDDDELKQKWTILQNCPFCGSERISLTADEESLRIRHICEDCDDGKEIPIYITDEEIYRYLPTFVIATIDKIAILGQTRKFRNILGLESKKCPRHGFVVGQKCFYSNAPDPYKCSVAYGEFENSLVSELTPSLLIQDELHLIREVFGSFDSHYESFIIYLLDVETGGKKPLKIIGATATASETYSDQIEELYLRHAIRFPSSGPRINESFYVREKPEEIARYIVGLSAHHKSRIDTVLDLIKYLRQEVLALENNPEKLAEMGLEIENKEDALELLSDYSTVLSYHLRRSDGEAINTSIGTMVNPEMKKSGFPPLNFKSLTSDVSFAKVKEVLKSLEVGERIDLITATSFISHGVDIDKLNCMILQGMPRSNAEYLQALSRVGRRYPGLVIMAFNTTYERDRSYYQYFQKFHEFIDLLIEPVPISRWAKFSIMPTLGGIFCGAIFCHFEKKVFERTARNGKGRELYMSTLFNNALDTTKCPECQDVFTEQLTIDFLKKAYGLHLKPNHHYEEMIESRVRHFFDCIQEANFAHIPQVLQNKQIKVMSSLRDIEKQIDVSALRDKEIVESCRAIHDSEEFEEGGEEQ